MLTRKVQISARGSFFVFLPKQLLKTLGIGKGSEMEMRYEGNEIILTPVPLARQDNNGTGAETTHPEVCANE